MSPLDTLLLDPAPFETFVAYRVDSIKGSGPGSGTLSDPLTKLLKVESQPVP